MRRAMCPLSPGRCTRAPGQRSDRPFSVTSPPRKPKSWRIDSDIRSEERHTSPPRPQKGSALPRLSISRVRPGESRGMRRAMRPLRPGRCTRAPGQRSDRPFSVTSPTSKTEVVADRFRHPFRGATHVPSSFPERQRSAAIFVFEGASGRVEPRQMLRRAVRPVLPRTVHEGPRAGERQSLPRPTPRK